MIVPDATKRAELILNRLLEGFRALR